MLSRVRARQFTCTTLLPFYKEDVMHQHLQKVTNNSKRQKIKYEEFTVRLRLCIWMEVEPSFRFWTSSLGSLFARPQRYPLTPKLG